MPSATKTTASLFTLRPTSALCPHHHLTSPRRPLLHPLSRRAFSNPLTPLQTLTASRILPYRASDVFSIIADIESYPSFIPYCSSSTITSHSEPDSTYKKRWPRAADLRVGWGSYNEVFRSKVYCQPYKVLEAVAGSAESTLREDDVPHYYPSSSSSDSEKLEENPLFTSLLTRWSLHEFPFKSPPMDNSKAIHDAGSEEDSAPRTEVHLVIEARFASVVYSALSQAAAPKVAGMMIEAFEKRAKEVLGRGHAAGREGIERHGSRRSSTLQGVTGHMAE